MKPQSLSKSHNKGERLEPLSIVPVFIDLHGKRVIVIGVDMQDLARHLFS